MSGKVGAGSKAFFFEKKKQKTFIFPQLSACFGAGMMVPCSRAPGERFIAGRRGDDCSGTLQLAL
jgi:hypothetical protein